MKKLWIIIIVLLLIGNTSIQAKAESIYTVEYDEGTGKYIILKQRDSENVLNGEYNTEINYTDKQWFYGNNKVVTDLVMSLGYKNPYFRKGSNTQMESYFLLSSACEANYQTVNVGKSNEKNGIKGLDADTLKVYKNVLSQMADIKNSKYIGDEQNVVLFKKIRAAVNSGKLTWKQVFVSICNERYLPVFYQIYYNETYNSDYWQKQKGVNIENLGYDERMNYIGRSGALNDMNGIFGKVRTKYIIKDSYTMYYKAEKLGGISKVTVSGYNKSIVDVKTKVIEGNDYVYVKGLKKGKTELSVKLITLEGTTVSYKVDTVITAKNMKDLKCIKNYSPLSYTSYVISKGAFFYLLDEGSINESYIKNVNNIIREHEVAVENPTVVDIGTFDTKKEAEQYIKLLIADDKESSKNEWSHLFSSGGKYEVPSDITKNFDRFVWIYNKLLQLRKESTEYFESESGADKFTVDGQYLLGRKEDDGIKTESEIIADYQKLAILSYQLAGLEMRDIEYCEGIIKDGELCNWEIDAEGNMRFYNPQLEFSIKGNKIDLSKEVVTLSEDTANKGMNVTVTGDKNSFRQGYLLSVYSGKSKSGNKFSGKYAYEIKTGDTLYDRTIEFFTEQELNEKRNSNAKKAVEKMGTKKETVIPCLYSFTAIKDELPDGVKYQKEWDDGKGYSSDGRFIAVTDIHETDQNIIEASFNIKDCESVNDSDSDASYLKVVSGRNLVVIRIEKYEDIVVNLE
jgi:hypothetical protein